MIARHVLTFALLSLPVAAHAAGFQFAVLDVGQGDASVVVAPSGCAALFDGGPKGSGAIVQAWLAAHGVTRLDYVVASHYHADHIGGLDEVDQGAGATPVVQVLDRGGTYSSLAYTEYANRFAGKRTTAVPGQRYSLCGEVVLEIVAANANGNATTDENARSVAVKVSYGAFDALIGGDLETTPFDMEAAIGAAVGEVEVYKVHHHGSRGASSEAFLSAIRPQNAFISVGLANTYGHPHPDAVARLEAVGAGVWLTEDPTTKTKRGAIEVATPDGRTYAVRQGADARSFTVHGADVSAPTVPGDVVATTAGSSRIDVRWAASTDDVAVAGYRVSWSGDGTTWYPLATTPELSLADTDLPVDTDFWYRVSAHDAAGNESAPSVPARARTTDLLAPTAPTGLWARATSPFAIDLGWSAAVDDVGVTGYRVRRDGMIVGIAPETSWSDAVGPGETHSYVVSAHDAAGNHSADSDAAAATTSCSITIPQKSFGTSTGYLYVKALSSDSTASLVASADGRELGPMIYSATYGSFSIRRKTGTRPACVTVTSSCGGAAVSCF